MIEAITGQPGAGKTLMMVSKMIKERRNHEFLNKYLKKNKELIQISNFSINEDILPNVIYLKNEDINNLYNWILEKKYFGASIYLDEASILFPSLAWASIPSDVVLALRQHRHAGYNLYFTAQDLDDVAKGLRNITQFCTHVDGWSLFHFSLYFCYGVKRGKIDYKNKYNRGILPHRSIYYNAYNTHNDIAKPEYLNVPQRFDEYV